MARAHRGSSRTTLSQSSRTVGAEPQSDCSISAVIGCLGVVFGDISTSPLYAIRECFTHTGGATLNPANLFGVLSMIFWSLTLIVTFKYIALLMRVDNRGEGGILALMALTPETRRFLSSGRTHVLVLLGLLGTCLLFGDGIITPAISVLSAVEGLSVATHVFEPAVVPITIVILFLLFAVQHRGTRLISRWFGPVTLLWLLTIAVLGLFQILLRPDILRALSPHYAVAFFANNGPSGFWILGGVILAVTGAEAVYADMGHFGKRPIRLAWLWFAGPCLLLAYFGQGALLLERPEAITNPFYALVPNGPTLYFVIVLATAATVIASQALISGVFSLTHQAVRLGILPRLMVRHTSDTAEGQIYLPFINWMLALGSIGLVLAFRKSALLASAYGLAVAGTMLATTLVFMSVMRSHLGWPTWTRVLLSGLFLTVDLAFFGANLDKIDDGGYIPLTLAVAILALILIWARGRSWMRSFMREETHPLELFFEEIRQHRTRRTPGVLAVMATSPEGVPPVLYRLVRRFHMLQEHVLLITVVSENEPYIDETLRVRTTDLELGWTRITIGVGFMEFPRVDEIVSRWVSTHVKTQPNQPPTEVVYLLGRETFVPGAASAAKRLQENIFSFLLRNARAATDYFRLPPERVIEIGAQYSRHPST